MNKELLTDEKGEYIIINGEKIYQIKCETEYDRQLNDKINQFRSRPKGVTVQAYLRSQW